LARLIEQRAGHRGDPHHFRGMLNGLGSALLALLVAFGRRLRNDLRRVGSGVGRRLLLHGLCLPIDCLPDDLTH
jgi:hypothetical protein